MNEHSAYGGIEPDLSKGGYYWDGSKWMRDGGLYSWDERFAAAGAMNAASEKNMSAFEYYNNVIITSVKGQFPIHKNSTLLQSTVIMFVQKRLSKELFSFDNPFIIFSNYPIFTKFLLFIVHDLTKVSLILLLEVLILLAFSISTDCFVH